MMRRCLKRLYRMSLHDGNSSSVCRAIRTGYIHIIEGDKNSDRLCMEPTTRELFMGMLREHDTGDTFRKRAFTLIIISKYIR